MENPSTGVSARELIVDAVGREGPLAFSRYMELALYDPGAGFYATGGAGRRRDFITSPEVGPLFGALVARALDGWWDELGRPEPYTFVEAGAGPGTLARSVLRAQPRCLDALDYATVEVSEAQRSQHPDGVRALDAMPPTVDHGVVFANELLDNLPFDIVGFEPDSGWYEVRVDVCGEQLVELREPLDQVPATAATPPSRAFRMPLQTSAHEWLRHALAAVTHGRVVVIDYTVPRFPAEPGRTWLRTYAAHVRGESPLVDPGTADITADVDLGALSRIREPERTCTQAEWLHEHGIDDLVAEGRAIWEAEASAPSLQAIAMRSRATERAALVDPASLGAFTVAEWRRDQA